jgi:hypothetical protein
VPLQFGVGFDDIDLCLAKLAEYGITSIRRRELKRRELKHRPDSTLYFITVADALCVNVKILENEQLSEQVVRQRVDLMQMLENVNPWKAFGIRLPVAKIWSLSRFRFRPSLGFVGAGVGQFQNL